MSRYFNDTISNDDLYGDYVAHHGILGMKWGVRRYQDAKGHLTPAGRKRYATDVVGTGYYARKKKARGVTNRMNDSMEELATYNYKIASLDKEKKARKKQVETLKKARVAAKQKQLEADQIRKIVSSGSAADVYNNRRRMSPEQITEAYNRLTNDQRLAQLALNEKNLQPKKKSKVDKVLGIMDKTTKAINTGVGLANAIGGAKKLIQGDDPTGAKAREKAKNKAIQSGDLSAISPYISSMSSQDWKDFKTVYSHQDWYNREIGSGNRRK